MQVNNVIATYFRLLKIMNRMINSENINSVSQGQISRHLDKTKIVSASILAHHQRTTVFAFISVSFDVVWWS